MIWRLLIIAIVISATPSFGATGSKTIVGPFNGFSAYSTSAGKVRAATPASTLVPSLATPTADGLMSKGKSSAAFYIDDYGAIGDGTKHLVSSQYTLSAAQNKWPNAGITSGNIGVWTIDDAATHQANYDASTYHGRLVFGGKTYFLSTGLVNTASLVVQGQGMWATILLTDYNGTLIDCPNDAATISDLGIIVSGTPGINQIGINFGNGLAQIRGGYTHRVYFNNNYTAVNWDSLTGGGISNSYIYLPYKYGLKITNNYNADQGDNNITDTVFTDINHVSAALIYLTKGSGLRINGGKLIHGNYGLLVDTTGVTTAAESLIQINGTSLEANYNSSIKITGDTGNKFVNILLNGIEANLYTPINTAVIDINNAQRVSITGCNVDSYNLAGSTGIRLRNIDTINITGGNISQNSIGIDYDATVTNFTINSPQFTNNIANTNPNNNVTALLNNVGGITDITKIWSSSSASNIISGLTSIGDGSRLILRAAGAGNTTIVPNSLLGSVGFRGLAGTVFLGSSSANMLALSEDTFTSTSTPTALNFSTTPAGSSASQNRMYIAGNGNVGIGSSFAYNVWPSEKLEVDGNVKATYFKGDGSLLTNLPSGTLPIVAPTGTGVITLPAVNTSYYCTGGQTGYILPNIATTGDRINISTTTAATVQAGPGQALYINGSRLDTPATYTIGAGESVVLTFKSGGGVWVCDAKDKYIAGGGSVTSVTSANSDISVATTTTTPILTLNSGIAANQIVKLDANARLGVGTVTPSTGLEVNKSTDAEAQVKIISTNASSSVAGGSFRVYSDDGASLSSGDRLGFMVFGGAKDASHTLTAGARIDALSEENWTSTSAATRLAILTTPMGATSPVEHLSVTSAGHTEYSGTTPAVTTCGTSPSVVGNDNTGTITVGSGVVMACTLSFVANANCTGSATPFACCTGSGTGTCGTGWTNAPNCFVTGNSLITLDVTAKSTTSITFGASATVAGGTLDYFCVGRR